MTGASFSSGKLGDIRVERRITHRDKERYFRKIFCSLLLTVATVVRAFRTLLRLGSRAPSGFLQPTQMALIRAAESEPLTDYEPIKLSSFDNMLAELVPRDKSVTAVIKSLVWCSMISNSDDNVSLPEACLANAAMDLVSRGLVRGAFELDYRRYIHAPKLVRRFTKALRLVETPVDEAASENFSANRDSLGATHLDNAVIVRVNEDGALLFIKAAAADTRDRKQTATFNGRALSSYAASLFQELKRSHSTACKKHPLSSNVFSPAEVLQTRTSSLPSKKMYWNRISVFSYGQAKKKATLAARGKAHGQPVGCAVK